MHQTIGTWLLLKGKYNIFAIIVKHLCDFIKHISSIPITLIKILFIHIVRLPPKTTGNGAPAKYKIFTYDFFAPEASSKL